MQQLVTRTGLLLERKAVLLYCFPTARTGARVGQTNSLTFTCTTVQNNVNLALRP